MGKALPAELPPWRLLTPEDLASPPCAQASGLPHPHMPRRPWHVLRVRLAPGPGEGPTPGLRLSLRSRVQEAVGCFA